MTRQRRSFSTEYKHEAAKLVLDQGYSMTEAARSLDVEQSGLRRWIKQLQQERSGTTPASKAMTSEQKRIQELEAKVKRLEQEKAILKNCPLVTPSPIRIETH